VCENDGAARRLIVFIDPPYSNAAAGQKLVDEMAAAAPSGTIVVWETEAAASDPAVPAEFEISRDKTYGRARLLILRKS
jgi:16S rRNA G966 N2-methylase RsmD